MCDILVPGDPKGLIRAVAQKIMYEAGDSTMKDAAVVVQDALPEKSIQKKVILAILCEKMPFANAKDVLSIGKQAFTTSRRYYRCLASGNKIRPTV